VAADSPSLFAWNTDLNFLTIHGRSRFPGLYVWTREGKKILVKVPPKCLLLQVRVMRGSSCLVYPDARACCDQRQQFHLLSPVSLRM